MAACGGIESGLVDPAANDVESLFETDRFVADAKLFGPVGVASHDVKRFERLDLIEETLCIIDDRLLPRSGGHAVSAPACEQWAQARLIVLLYPS